MKIIVILGILVVVLVGSAIVVGCTKSSPEPNPTAGPAERAGAALDRAAEKAGDTANKITEKAGEAAKQTSEATKDAASKAVAKTDEVLENAGAAMQKTGSDLQSGQATPPKP